MIQLNKSLEIKYIIGESQVLDRPMPLFSGVACDFLNDLSLAIRQSPECLKFADLATFSFWCRRGNILKIKEKYNDLESRLGSGLVFHVAPSNVPINFAFSFAFGLLSGNANIVRLPSKPFPQVELLCSKIRDILMLPRYEKIKQTNVFIQYPVDNQITESFSEIADAKMIWGGDRTIDDIKSLKAKTRSRDLFFGDRYSICVLNSEAINKADERALSGLAEKFYNDTFLMDQNACSSPSFILWTGSDSELAQDKFWSAILKTVTPKYKIQPISVIDKFTQLCVDSIEIDSIHFKVDDKFLYRAQLDKVPPSVEDLRGKCGYFYELKVDKWSDVLSLMEAKCQTLTYFGEDPNTLMRVVLDNSLKGVDRIVPVGSALDIGIIWDGYDIIRTLSRFVSLS